MGINRKIARNGRIQAITDVNGSTLNGENNLNSVIFKPVVSENDTQIDDGINLKAIDLDHLVLSGSNGNIRSKTAERISPIDSIDKVLSPVDQECAVCELSKAPTAVSANIVKSSVKELSEKSVAMDELKSSLRARGIRMPMSNVMLELALQENEAELDKIMLSATKASEEKYGEGAISLEELKASIENMLSLEKDILYTRKLCKERGLDIQSLNILSQLIRQNPGDGGEKIVNTIFGYAASCGIKLSGIEAIKQEYTQDVDSVLPKIKSQKTVTGKYNFKRLILDVFIGVTLTIILVAWLV